MVEHQSRKLGVVGSNPTGGNILSLEKLEKLSSQLAGFEPTRAEPIGFQVQRLNHSATTAICSLVQTDILCILTLLENEKFLK